MTDRKQAIDVVLRADVPGSGPLELVQREAAWIVDAILALQPQVSDYGYTKRSSQTDGHVVVPVALLEEARDGCSPGDARSLLERVLAGALAPQPQVTDEMVGRAASASWETMRLRRPWLVRWRALPAIERASHLREARAALEAAMSSPDQDAER